VGPLHIGFDGQILRRQRRGGISRYFCELAAALPQAGVHVSPASSTSTGWWQRGTWRQADVVHATFYGGRPYRPRRGQRLVSSLFDMVPERHPEHFFLPGLRSPHANKASWLSASDLIISISAASADDLVFFHPGLQTPVQVIHLATALDRIPPEPVARLQGRRFWLMVGKRHAYKNGMTLMRALALLHRLLRRSRRRCLHRLTGGEPCTTRLLTVGVARPWLLLLRRLLLLRCAVVAMCRRVLVTASAHYPLRLLILPPMLP
jgi:hypothetical protein